MVKLLYRFPKPIRIGIIAFFLLLLAFLAYWGFVWLAEKVSFYENTRLVLPKDLKDDQKRDFLQQRQEIIQAKDHGKNNSLLYNDIGVLRMSLKDYQGAIRSFQLAIQKNPSDPRFYRNLGLAFNYQKDYKNAEQSFLKLISLAPQNPEFWLDLGDIYAIQIKDLTKARNFYETQLKNTFNNLDVLKAYINFLEFQAQDYPKAIDYLKILIQKDQDYKEIYQKRLNYLSSKIKK